MTFKDLLLITAIAAPTSFAVATTAHADTSFDVAPYIQDMDDEKKAKKMKMKKKMKKERGMEMSAEMKAKFAKCYEMEGEAKAACKAPLLKERKEMHEKKMKKHKKEMKEHHKEMKGAKKEMKEHKKEMKVHKEEMEKDSDS